jgi:hypothetical protein
VRPLLSTPLLFGLLLTAGGCFHSDSARNGFTEEGKFWCERVADTVSADHIDTLRAEILALGDDVNPVEAELLADVSVRHAAALADAYDMVRPIEIHNTLVNLGLRKRGLCYQTAEDMYVRLRDLRLRTLDLHWGVAHKDDMWLEHSGVIVTAKGRPFAEGLVIDAWRHSGRLRWARVEEDRYPWAKMYKRKFPETMPPREGGIPRTDVARAREPEREAKTAAASEAAGDKGTGSGPLNSSF